MRIPRRPVFPGVGPLISKLTEWAEEVTKAINDESSDTIKNDATKGLVLKDTQSPPHYWRVTVSNAGALVITDLGTTKP